MDTFPSSPVRLDDTIAIWAEMIELGKKNGCMSLGEGAPGYKPPQFLRDLMLEAMDENVQNNQYCRSFGHPLLVNQVAKQYGPQLGRIIDPMTEILVTAGANGALGAFITALVNPGDELVVFEPAFPMYFDHTQLNGGVLKAVPLVCKDGAWVFDPAVLRS